MKHIKKILKWLSITVLILLALLVLVPYAFRNKLTEAAKAEINKNVNARVGFGDISLSFFSAFPNLNLIIRDFSITGREDFEKDTLAQFRKLELRLALLSLLQSSKEIKSIFIDHPVINTKVLENGKANWDISKPSAAEPENENTSSAFKLTLNKITINKAGFIYADHTMDFVLKAEGIDMQLSGNMDNSKFAMHSIADAKALTLSYEGIKYLSKVRLNMQAITEFDFKNARYTFTENKILINELGLGVDGFIEMPAEGINMDISIHTKHTEFKHLLSLIPAVYKEDGTQIQTQGKFFLKASAKGMYNEKHLPAFDVQLQVEDGYFKYPHLPASAENIRMSAHIKNKDGNPDNTIVNLQHFHAELAGNPVDAKLRIANPVSDPGIEGMLKGSVFLHKIKDIVPEQDITLRGLLQANLEFKGKMSAIEKKQYENFMADGNMLLSDFFFQSKKYSQSLTIKQASLAFSPQFVELKNFDALFGKSDFAIKGKIENLPAYFLKNKTLKGNFDFSSQYIDADEWLTDTDAETDTAQENTLHAFNVPANINFSLQTAIKKMRYGNIDITDIQGDILMSDKKLQLKKLNMHMLEGNISMKGFYDAKNIDMPSVGFDLDITEFDIGKTAKTFISIGKLAPVITHCSGTFSASVSNYSCVLNKNMKPALNTINASGYLRSKNIQLDNSDLFNKIGNLLKSDKFKHLKAKDVKLNFSITNGNIFVQPFTTELGNIKTTISGRQGLDQSLDYRMDFAIPRSEFGRQANMALDKLAAEAHDKGIALQMSETLNIHALISGTISNPEIKLDVAEQGKNAVQNIKKQAVERINEESKKAKNDAVRKAREQANDLLAEADKKAQQIISLAEQSSIRIKKQGAQAAEKIRTEAETQAKQIEAKASGQIKPLRTAAKKAADKLRKEAENKALEIEKEAAKKAEETLKKAQMEAENLRNKAKAQGLRLMEKANKQ